MQFQFKVDQAIQPDNEGIAILQGHQVAAKLKALKGDGMKHLA